MSQLKSFSQYILQIGYKYGLHSVFEDFLEMAVCALSLRAKEDRYLEIVRNYEKPDAYLMAEAFGALVMEMDNNGEGLKDGFGDFYMEYISHGHNGQFFTPEPICELMARMINPAGFGDRVADCCCGSGRMLLAAAKIKRDCLFFGADVDRTCAMMCLINLCLNGLLGEVCWIYLSNYCLNSRGSEKAPFLFVFSILKGKTTPFKITAKLFALHGTVKGRPASRDVLQMRSVFCLVHLK